MTVVKANCPGCGEVEMPHTQVTIMICDYPWLSTYEFRCPGCHGYVTKPTDDRITSLLLAAGAQVHQWYMPLEVLEHPNGAASITMDDVLDFVFGLADLTPEKVIAESVI